MSLFSDGKYLIGARPLLLTGTVKFSLCLIKHHATRLRDGWRYGSKDFYLRHCLEMNVSFRILSTLPPNRKSQYFFLE
jgi:hypothetical protein